MLAPVEKPQRARQRNRIKEVRGDGCYYIHRFRLQELLSDLQLRAAGVHCGARHNEARAPFLIQCAVEDLNPQVVGVVQTRQPKRETRITLESVLVYAIHVEGWVCHDKVELAAGRGTFMEVLVVGVPL